MLREMLVLFCMKLGNMVVDVCCLQEVRWRELCSVIFGLEGCSTNGD